MVLPDALEALEESIALQCALDSLGAAACAAQAGRAARPWKRRHDERYGELVQVLVDQLPDAVVQLVAVCILAVAHGTRHTDGGSYA
jgi:hypothetical protein